MPESAEVLAVYGQTGTISGVADHFGVPRHTVAGWARRLRREGHTIGRS
jgi:transposase